MSKRDLPLERILIKPIPARGKPFQADAPSSSNKKAGLRYQRYFSRTPTIFYDQFIRNSTESAEYDTGT
jgi:hypothetical protein